ncbi:MAG: hypothetical protein ACXWVS_08360 [Hyphomicrobium sp.]
MRRISNCQAFGVLLQSNGKQGFADLEKAIIDYGEQHNANP